MKKIKSIILKAGSQLPPVATIINDDLDEFYKIIECDTIDIVARKIGNTYYDIICDDEGLFKDNPIVSVVSEDGLPLICGTIIICNSKEGNLTSLKEGDIDIIKKHIRVAEFKESKERFYVLQVGY